MTDIALYEQNRTIIEQNNTIIALLEVVARASNPEAFRTEESKEVGK